MLDCLPNLEEIKKAVFFLDKDSAPGPNGFFTHCWDIIKQDVLFIV